MATHLWHTRQKIERSQEVAVDALGNEAAMAFLRELLRATYQYDALLKKLDALAQPGV